MEPGDRNESSVCRRSFLKYATVGTLGTAFSRTAEAHSNEDSRIYVGGGSTLYAIDPTDGSIDWEFTRSSGRLEDSSPTVVDGTVYIGSSDGDVFAVAAQTGELEWAFSDGVGRLSSPTIVDDTVYVCEREDPSTGETGGVYALDADSGELLWQFTGLDRGGIREAPNVVGDSVYIGSTDDGVYALDAATGDPRWTTQFGSYRSPVVSSDSVYVSQSRGYQPDLEALSVESGETDWTFGTDSASFTSPTVYKSRVYVGSGNTLYAVSDTGEEIFSVELPLRITSAPTAANDTVYVGSGSYRDGDASALYAFDHLTGEQLWSFSEPQNRIEPPTVANDTVYVPVGGSENTLYSVDAESGEERFALELSGFLSAPTVVSDPEAGDSVDSAVERGTLGHHDAFAEHGARDLTEIRDWHELNAIRSGLSGEYVLMNDLDRETDGYDEYVADPEAGWEPIGDAEASFEGTFDGGANRITGLIIDRPDADHVGLFSSVNGRIERLGLVGASVTGGDGTAGLVGVNRGEITEAFVRGTVTGEIEVGGLAGRNAGGAIEATYTIADVTGDSIVGGLVGMNSGGTVFESYAAHQERDQS